MIHTYEVYATRWDDAHIVEELIPARDLSFSLPLSDHGEASFSATVEPGRSFWRPAMALPLSGILIARDGQPVWSGWVTDESEQGDRTFSFTCREWGHFLEEKVPAVPHAWTTPTNDHIIARAVVTESQAVPGQNVLIEVDPTTLGAASSKRTINAWDDTTVGRELRSISDAQGGPEWYVATTGSLDDPRRRLVLGDRLGHTSPQVVLEYVEETEDYRLPDAPPLVALLGDLLPGAAAMVPTRRAGGNVLAKARTQSVANAATVVNAWGSGEEASRKVKTRASSLLSRGWPRMTRSVDFSDVSEDATLQARANAELARSAGIATGYALVTLDSDPDWTQVPRGSSVQVVLDTDVYGGERPVGGPNGFSARVLDTVVRVPETGDAQVEWRVAETLEV